MKTADKDIWVLLNTYRIELIVLIIVMTVIVLIGWNKGGNTHSGCR